jgi:Zn-dependent oligopeptidase
MAAIKARLAVLGTQFAQNVLADERDWVMPLAEGDLEGAAEFVVQAARSAGEGQGGGRAGRHAVAEPHRAVPPVLAAARPAPARLRGLGRAGG